MEVDVEFSSWVVSSDLPALLGFVCFPLFVQIVAQNVPSSNENIGVSEKSGLWRPVPYVDLDL